MQSYSFSISLSSDNGSVETQDVDVKVIAAGIQFSCNTTDSECVHVLDPGKLDAYLKAIGCEGHQEPITATKEAFEAGRAGEIVGIIHDLAPATFVWYDSDSGFYSH